MTIAEKFESLHPDVIQDFLKTSKSHAIPIEVQRFILVLDRIPELQRRFPNITRCARELMAKYPDFKLSFQMAREFIYTAINYFHLNSNVRNEAWNQYYADRAEDLHNICVQNEDFKTAKEYLSLAHEWRLSKNENQIDAEKLRPVFHLISPEVTPQMLGLGKEYSLKDIWTERNKRYTEAISVIDKMDINSDDKERLREEARQTYNISDATIE